MEENMLLEAGKLLVVGLTTVFVALLLIILMGNLLIKLVNKYCPEEVAKPAVAKVAQIDANVTTAINKAIAQLTNGKGKVEKIEKI